MAWSVGDPLYIDADIEVRADEWEDEQEELEDYQDWIDSLTSEYYMDRMDEGEMKG